MKRLFSKAPTEELGTRLVVFPGYWIPLFIANLSFVFNISVVPLITQKPVSVTVETGENVSLSCRARGQPKPRITWRKAFSELSKENAFMSDNGLTIINVTKKDAGTYACVAKNLLGEVTAVAMVTVTDRLRFTTTPPKKIVAFVNARVYLHCAIQGASEIFWKRKDKNLHYIIYPDFPNGTLLLNNCSYENAGPYTCVAKNSQRLIEAVTILEMIYLPSCSGIKRAIGIKRSGNYKIDPDGEGGVKAFSVYCDMRDKGMVGVTVISHDSESRTHVNHIIPGCGGPGCYRKDVTYFGVNAAQLAALNQVSRHCEQFIKYECNPSSPFIERGYAWWASRDGTRMDYWGGATGHNKICGCGVTNSCSNGRKCNCPSRTGWSEDSGLLTDKSSLPVSQIRLGDLDSSQEEGFYTLGKLKCYG